MGRLQAERDQQDREVADEFDREIKHLREASADLLQICSDPREAARYFALADWSEIEENEFNLNLPRYVNTFTRPTEIPLTAAIQDLNEATEEADTALAELRSLLMTTSPDRS